MNSQNVEILKDKEENVAEVIDKLILDLSLVSTLPIGPGGRNYIAATSAANSFATKTKNMAPKDLRNLEWTVGSLLSMLKLDIEDPVAEKAAFGLKTLMFSRVCMSRLLSENGLDTISRVLDILLAKKISDLKKTCVARNIVEHLATCYREIARYYNWELVNCGAIRHCVLILRFGDTPLKAISASTLASLSNDLEICKQMFSYGAIKPLLNASDGSFTNESCMLAGLGCLTQLCRIPEIGVRLVQQGAVPILEKAINWHIGYNNLAVREKGMYTLGFLSKIDSVKSKLCSQKILTGVSKEFFSGTIQAKYTIIGILMNLHKKYENEREYILQFRDNILNLLKDSPWNCKNLCIKAICVLYTEMEDKLYLTKNGIVESLLKVLKSKNKDLQEAPMVAFLYLCQHPDIPPLLLQKGVSKIAVDFLYAKDPIIKELTVILFKAFSLYNIFEVERVVPAEKTYLLKRDPYNPQLFGADYGGLIQEYLQDIVENRRMQNYLIDQFSQEDIDNLGLTQQELESYQNTFMEIDAECLGALGIDELKMLMVLMGEKMDKDEISELLDEYDEDKSGNLDFKEFVIMMKGWNTRFGKGLARMYNISTKRGAIGKSRREFSKWWNQPKIDAAQIAAAKEKRRRLKAQDKSFEVEYMQHEKIKMKREKEIRLRELGFSRSKNYPERLPPINNNQY